MRYCAFLLVILFILCNSKANAQYSQLESKDKDSVKTYPYTFPFLGKKAVAKGFNIPYPAGIMINTFIGKSDITISDLQLGFTNANHDIPLTPVELIKFGTSTATIKNVNFRPDLWISVTGEEGDRA